MRELASGTMRYSCLRHSRYCDFIGLQVLLRIF